MAGGTWIDQNKVRPGVYINYKSAPASLATMGERGVVAIARAMDWGEQGKFYTIEDPSDCAKLGHAITDDEMLFIRQILLGSNRTQGATKILLWNLAQSTTPISGGTGESTSSSSATPVRSFEHCKIMLADTDGDNEGAVYDNAEISHLIPPVDGAEYYVCREYPFVLFHVGTALDDDTEKPAIIAPIIYSEQLDLLDFTLDAYTASRTVGSISGCSISNDIVTDYGHAIVDSDGNPVQPMEGATNYKITTDNPDLEGIQILIGEYEGEKYLTASVQSEVALFDITGFAPVDSSSSGASKASVTIGNLTATALYTGSYGNRLSLSVTAGTGDTFIVQTLLDGQVVDSQTVSSIAGLVANQYCTFSGEGEITTTTSPVAFSGGSTGEPTATAYSDFLNALELQKFDVVIYDGEDATIKGAFIDFVKRLSNREGVKCQAVVSDANNPDNECVINVYPQSVTLTNGTVLTPEQLTWWVGGASAGANVFESLTYAAYPDAIDVNPVLTSSQQEDAINAGKFALIAQFDRIQVLTDINSFTTFAVEKGKAFRKNRVIRTIFGLCNDIYKTFATYYIGAVHNDEEGRKALKAEILDLMNRYQGNRALQNVEAEDVTVLKGVESDAVVIEIYCQPVDSIEKIYINITIS